MVDHPAVRVEISGPVWTVVLDRPDRRNAVDGATAQQLAEVFRRFDAEPAALVAVLWGAGGRQVMAGASHGTARFTAGEGRHGA
jgi:enoyl-CoA hydratase